MESGRYVSKEDPQRGGATMFKYNDADVRDLFNSIRYKRREDKANRAAKKSEVDGVLGKISEEVWKYDTEAYESEYNALMDRINNIYAENDKGDYYDIPFTKQIEIKKEISRLNQLADKSLQDKSNYDAAVKLAYQRLDDVDIKAFEAAAEKEMLKPIGEKDFFNIMPLQKLEDVDYNYYEINPEAYGGAYFDEKLGKFVSSTGKKFDIKDSDYVGAWDIQNLSQKRKFAEEYGYKVEDIEKEVDNYRTNLANNKSAKLNEKIKGNLYSLFKKVGQEAKNVRLTSQTKGGGKGNLNMKPLDYNVLKSNPTQYRSGDGFVTSEGKNSIQTLEFLVNSTGVLNLETGKEYGAEEGGGTKAGGKLNFRTNEVLYNMNRNGEVKHVLVGVIISPSGKETPAMVNVDEAATDYGMALKEKLKLTDEEARKYVDYNLLFKGMDGGESTEDDNTNTGGAY
jgi:hypothetical protein